jgi:hypothetical protein
MLIHDYRAKYLIGLVFNPSNFIDFEFLRWAWLAGGHDGLQSKPFTKN